MPRRAACGRVPLASHRAMNRGGTSTSRTFDTAARDAGGDLGLDMTALRFARQPMWPPLASPTRIARRRVKVCAATRLDLDAPSTMRCWDDNGGHILGKPSRLVGWVLSIQHGPIERAAGAITQPKAPKPALRVTSECPLIVMNEISEFRSRQRSKIQAHY